MERWSLAVEVKNGQVWNECRPKREKVAWSRLDWSSNIVPKHAILRLYGLGKGVMNIDCSYLELCVPSFIMSGGRETAGCMAGMQPLKNKY